MRNSINNDKQSQTAGLIDNKIEKKALNLAELCESIGLTKWAVYSLVSRDEIPHIKIGKRLAFLPKDIDRWLEQKKRAMHAKV